MGLSWPSDQINPFLLLHLQYNSGGADLWIKKTVVRVISENMAKLLPHYGSQGSISNTMEGPYEVDMPTSLALSLKYF